MEDGVTLEPYKPTKEEVIKRQYDDKAKDIRISLARATVVKSQASQAYNLLENIRFDYLGDSAFRDELTQAKKHLEYFIGDFLLDDHYWHERKAEHKKMTPKQYDAYLKSIPTQTASSKKIT